MIDCVNCNLKRQCHNAKASAFISTFLFIEEAQLHSQIKEMCPIQALLNDAVFSWWKKVDKGRLKEVRIKKGDIVE